MKKRFSLSVAFMALAISAIGIVNGQKSKDSFAVDAASQLEGQITSVQVRSGGSNSNFISILDSNINPAGISISVTGTNYNAPNYVNVYLSPTSEAVSLSSIINTSKNWEINLWTSGGVLFPLSDETFETYNGTTIYAIEILEGCTYPNNNFDKITVNETVKFLNGSYGNPSAKCESFYWTEALNPSEVNIDITNGQVRADQESNFYSVSLVSPSFAEVEVIDYPTLLEINAYDKIKLFLSEEDQGKTLGQITSLRSGTQNRWGSEAFLFNLTAEEYEIYNGTTTYKIVVEAGCQLVLNNTIVTITQNYILLNSNYGDASCKNGAFYFMPYTEHVNEPISLFNAQVRADVFNGFYFIDVRSTSYTNQPVIQYNNLGDLNTYSHIKIYRSAADKGTLLGDVTFLRSGYQNLWTSEAMLFSLTAEEYELFNGTTIFKIEVLEGCELYVNGQVAIVDRAYSFINGDYGKESAKYEAFNFELEATQLKYFGEAELSSIHNRMDNASGYRWLMFFFSDELFNSDLNVTTWIEKVNLLDNILIYYSANGEPVTLREIYDPSTTGVSLQLFGIRNMLGVSILNEKIGDRYKNGGPDMYKITIQAGTQIPNMEDGETGYRLVAKETSFINADYGKYGEIPGSFDDEGNPRLYEEWSINWVVEISGLVNLGEVGISTIHNRMDKDSGYRWIMIMLDKNIYNVSLDVSEWMDRVNLMDNISIYFSENGEPVTLGEIYDPSTTGVTIQLFNQKNMIAISISNERIGEEYKYCGPNMYKIIVEQGTQIPTYENGIAGYREIESKTVLLNDDYELSGEIDGTMDDFGNPRLYEEWNVNWNVASCYVTFTVIGLPEKSYADMLLDYGQRISLETFAVDGYELTATTAAGETIYEYIIGSNHNIDVILSYTQVNKEEPRLTFWQKIARFFRRLFGGKNASVFKGFSF